MSAPTAKANVSAESATARESVQYSLQFPRANSDPEAFDSYAGSPWIPLWTSRLMGHVKFEEWKEFHEYAASAVAECAKVLRLLENGDIDGHEDENGDKGHERNNENCEAISKPWPVWRRISTCLDVMDECVRYEEFDSKPSMLSVLNSAVRGAAAIAFVFHPRSDVRRKVSVPLICSHAGGVPVRKPLLVTPDCVVVDSEWGEGKPPNVTVEYRTPDLKLYSRGVSPSSACELGRNYQKLFDPHISDEYAADNMDLRRAVTQVIVHGLHTAAGFSVLYTHNEAVFVSLRRPLCKDQDVLVEARVSRVYACDERISTMHGLVAIIRQSLVEKGERQEDVEKSLLALANLPAAVDSREAVCSQMGNVSNKAGSSRDQGGPIGLLGGEVSDLTKKTPGPQERGVMPPGEISWKSKRSRECEEEAGPVSSPVKSAKGEVMKNNVAEDADDMVEELLRCHEGVIGKGSSGTVLAGSVNGGRVAVKYWSFAKGDGLEWLVNEMDVYEMLASAHPEVMGAAVARLVCVKRDPKNESESVLVTELVGRGVGRDADVCEDELGPMYVDGEMVSEEDEVKISEAAVKNLKMLHACGVSHGDTSLRNLRVDRVVGEDGVAGWNVWWIDLGFASMSPKPEQFSEELALVRRWKKAALARSKGGAEAEYERRSP